VILFWENLGNIATMSFMMGVQKLSWWRLVVCNTYKSPNHC